MIGAFNKIVKRLVGDKAATDVKAIQPAVDAVHTFESEMAGAVLRRASRAQCRLEAPDPESCGGVGGRVQRPQGARSLQIPRCRSRPKEVLYDRVDALEKEVDDKLEEVLEQLMPEAFALLKETSRRFAAPESWR